MKFPLVTRKKAEAAVTEALRLERERVRHQAEFTEGLLRAQFEDACKQLPRLHEELAQIIHVDLMERLPDSTYSFTHDDIALGARISIPRSLVVKSGPKHIPLLIDQLSTVIAHGLRREVGVTMPKILAEALSIRNNPADLVRQLTREDPNA